MKWKVGKILRPKEEILKDLEAIEIRSDNLDDSFTKLSQIAEEIEVKDPVVKNFIRNFVDYERMESLVKLKFGRYGVYTGLTFAKGIYDFNHSVFYVDDYCDSVRNVEKDDLELLKSDLKAELEG